MIVDYVFRFSLRQRGTSQRTVNVNELCTATLPGSCWFRMCMVWYSRV